MNTPDPDAEAQAFHQRLISETIPWIEQFTVSFMHVRKDPKTGDHDILGKDRSGVFFRIGSDHFLITAAHYIHGGGIPDYIDEEIFLYASWDPDDNIYIPVSDGVFALTPEDMFDIAVIKLLPDTATRLLKRHKPLTLDRVDRDCRSADGYFAIVGYPREGFEYHKHGFFGLPPQAPITESLKYVGKRRRDGYDDGKLKFSDEMHIVIGLDKLSARPDGTREEMPEHEQIQGISGCGIWLVADGRKGKPRKPLSQYGPEDCKLVAIEHTYDDKSNKAVGTWIDTTLAIIAKNFPETKAAIDLIFP